ncbi:MAG TPA: hypothetical protein VLT45_01300 [Kofleriaceae bacterium]|nr:hypothetical protein [Kofleriaceae bacterium]
MVLVDRIDALERRVRALVGTKDELGWRAVRAEATTVLVELRSRYASERREFLADGGAGEPSRTAAQLRRVREIIELIDGRLQTI